MNASERWALALASWTIPDEILSRAPESPWTFPPELFRSRAERATTGQPSTTTVRAAEALPAGGTVLDVGVGAGATSVSLWARASRVTGVDSAEAMLEEFRRAAAAAGVEAVAALGRWPDVAAEVVAADVVVCAHVLYNVQELEPFARALHEHARHRVVIEITSTHPLAWMSDLWLRFHDLQRPTEPTADVAEEALREWGFDVEREDVTTPPRGGGFERREDAVGLIRRRLCLTPDRDDEVAEALGDRLAKHEGLWSAGPDRQRLVTLWWDTVART
ncbi:MAG: methyltransferase domain-containing protein [Actinobacteria bacterium]|nr:MAG: methyltransferase domain-containing protein [Actinomycetota bacterium]